MKKYTWISSALEFIITSLPEVPFPIFLDYKRAFVLFGSKYVFFLFSCWDAKGGLSNILRGHQP